MWPVIESFFAMNPVSDFFETMTLFLDISAKFKSEDVAAVLSFHNLVLSFWYVCSQPYFSWLYTDLILAVKSSVSINTPKATAAPQEAKDWIVISLVGA